MSIPVRMPPEWAAHDRTWMAFPPDSATNADLDPRGLATVRDAWATVANTIVGFEPVTMVVAPADLALARTALDPRIDLLPAALDDAWMRDIGPTFVHAIRADQADGRDGPRRDLLAVDWVFNGWGAQHWANWAADAGIAAVVANACGAEVVPSSLINEGGGIHVDGRGTVLLTETVQLDPNRNPGATRAGVEAELRRTIGIDRAVWLPRGLTRDYDDFGTRGHVDIVAAFAGPDTIVFHDQRDRAHPDHDVSAEVRELLQAAGPWRLVGIPAPTVLRDEHGWVDYSYINHYVCNGAVILCAFDDPNDDVAARILQEAYPDRQVVLVDARVVFSRGGGIHCITQQQPAPR